MLPVRIDDVQEPLGYGELHTLDLVNWSGQADDPRFQKLSDAAKAMVAGKPLPAPMARTRYARTVTGTIDRGIAFTRSYFADLFDLLSGPKRFLADRRATHGTSLDAGAVRFLAISFLLTVLVELPLARGNLLFELVADAAFVTVLALLFGWVVYIAWRLVRTAAPMHQVFAIHFYLSGVLKLLATAWYLAVRGLLRSDPALYEEILTRAERGDLLWAATNAERLSGYRMGQMVALIFLCGLGATFLWVVVGWGAYRQLTGVSRARSLLAFLLFSIICIPVYIITVLLAAALV